MQFAPTTSQNASSWRQTPIVLIGLMGAGKTTIGRRLAKKIDREFIDSDDAIIEAAGCSIADIFAMYGEPIFRDVEERVLKRLLGMNSIVLATGGGAWMQPNVRKLIKENACSVWLRADISVLLSRVEHRSHRPLLEQGDKKAILERLMAERYPVYAEADITIDSNASAHESVVEAIIHACESVLGQGA